MMEKSKENFHGGVWKETTPKLKSDILSLQGYEYGNDISPDREWRADGGEKVSKNYA